MELSKPELKILLVEDTPLDMRGALGMLQDAGYLQVASAGSVSEARIALKTQACDFVIVDLRIPAVAGSPDTEKNGLDLVDDIKASNTPQIVLSRFSKQSFVAQITMRDIGYLLKTEVNPLLLDHAIQTTLSGGIVYTRTPHALLHVLLAKPNQRADPNHPTRRELEAIYLFVFKFGGKAGSDAKVADAMNITEHTARQHRRNFSEKLDLHTQAEVVNWAHRHPQEFDDVRDLYQDIPDAG